VEDPEPPLEQSMGEETQLPMNHPVVEGPTSPVYQLMRESPPLNYPMVEDDEDEDGSVDDLAGDAACEWTVSH
jgi:hypothetical protein